MKEVSFVCIPYSIQPGRHGPALPHIGYTFAKLLTVFFFATNVLKLLILVNQVLNYTFFSSYEKSKNISAAVLHVFRKTFRVEISKDYSESSTLDTSYTHLLIGISSQFYHSQASLLTIFHAPMLYTVILKSMIRHYVGIAECPALARHGVLRRHTTQRDAAARRPVDCMYSSNEGLSFY